MEECVKAVQDVILKLQMHMQRSMLAAESSQDALNQLSQVNQTMHDLNRWVHLWRQYWEVMESAGLAVKAYKINNKEK